MLGPDVVPLVDAAQLIASPKASIRLARRIEEFDIGWYEEPVMGSNPLYQTPVMRDERGASIVPSQPGWGFAIDLSILTD